MNSSLPMPRIEGSLVAIVTPMQVDGSIDYPALKNLIEWHILSGTDGIVIVGTTGESATVSVQEHCDLVKFAVQTVNKRIFVIAGSGGNSTREAIELTQFAYQAGADASLQVVPYYNKPTQEGMYQHFKAIAEATPLPILLYNVPGRTVADMSNDTIVRLASIPTIIGVKDATGNLARGIELLERVPADFIVLSGNDDSCMALVLCGGKGYISVTANVAPGLMRELYVAASQGEIAQARAINRKLLALHQILFIEPNPIPVKWALAQMGKCQPTLRLPLTPLTAGCYDRVREALVQGACLAPSKG